MDLLEAEHSMREVVMEPDTSSTDLLPESAAVKSDALLTVTVFDCVGVPPPVTPAANPTGPLMQYGVCDQASKAPHYNANACNGNTSFYKHDILLFSGSASNDRYSSCIGISEHKLTNFRIITLFFVFLCSPE
jgi:hypothetical protein